MSNAICTIASKSYLPQFILFARSIARFNGLAIILFVPDLLSHEKEEFTARLMQDVGSDGCELRVVCADELYGDYLHQIAYYYDILEFSCASKAFLHRWMFETTNFASWVYLDSDMLCFANLTQIFEILEQHPILLTPHSRYAGTSIQDDARFLSYGAFNAGFLGLGRSDIAREFIDWICRLLRMFCHVNDGLPQSHVILQAAYADQRALDLVPAYFDRVGVLRDLGYNVGYWNANGRRFDRQDDALILGDLRVKLLHMSTFDVDNFSRMSRHAPLDRESDKEWIAIATAYANDLNNLKGRYMCPYRFDFRENGTRIHKTERREHLIRMMSGLEVPANPFQA